jgi:sensor histidine kinase regulating citrate/malate metabolism
MGIPQDKFEEIFLPFSNPNAKNIGSAKSVGIGLTFCKTIVEAHGSHIEVQSEVGKGSIFSFVLPIVVGKEENPSENIEIVLTEEECALLLPTIEELKKYPMKNARVRQILQKMDTHNLPTLVAWQTAMLQAREKNDVANFEKCIYLATSNQN